MRREASSRRRFDPGSGHRLHSAGLLLLLANCDQIGPRLRWSCFTSAILSHVLSRSASVRAQPTPAIFCITDIDRLNSRDTRISLDISFDSAKRAETLKHRGAAFRRRWRGVRGPHRPSPGHAPRLWRGPLHHRRALDGAWCWSGRRAAGHAASFPSGTHMPTKKPSGLPEWTDPDDAPALTPETLDRAETFEGWP